MDAVQCYTAHHAKLSLITSAVWRCNMVVIYFSGDEELKSVYVYGSTVQAHSSNYCSAVFVGIINACLLLCSIQQ